MPDRPSAEVIVLEQGDDHILQFHRYAARLRARGRLVSSGDQLSVYRVASTVPEGPVMVTDATEFVFAG